MTSAGLQRVGARFCRAVDRRPAVVVSGFTILYAWLVFARASTKPLWHDEIYTVVLSTVSSLRSMWAAQLAGLDLMPPLNAVLTHIVAKTVGLNQISVRLPAMLGVWTMAVASFVLVQRRAGTVWGIAAMLLPLVTGSGSLAYEARGYGLMLGLFALMLLAWSEAAANRRRTVYLSLLAACIAAGIWSHYYAILGLVPVLAGEATRTFRTRRIDWGIAAAIAAGTVTVLPLLPLMRVASEQASTYWGRPTLAEAAATFRVIGSPLFDLPAFWFCSGLMTLAAWRSSSKEPSEQGPASIPSHEVVAGFATLAIPLCALLLGILVTGVFVPRYAILGAAGIAVVVPVALSRARRRNRLAPPIACVLLLLAVAYSYRDVWPGQSTALQSPLSYRPMLVRALQGPAPVVVTGTLYLQVWYYASPAQRASLYCVADPALARHFVGSDTVDRGYRVLRRWASTQVEDYTSFVAVHRQFVLYDVSTFSWITKQLANDGAVLRRLGDESGATVYAVTLPVAPSFRVRKWASLD